VHELDFFSWQVQERLDRFEAEARQLRLARQVRSHHPGPRTILAQALRALAARLDGQVPSCGEPALARER